MSRVKVVVDKVEVHETRPFPGRSVSVDLEGLVCLGAQVGGHVGIFLETRDGFVLKRCLPSEVEFYRKLAEGNVRECFFPESTGTIVLSVEIGEESVVKQTYLVMENVTFGFDKPSVMDVKVGTRPWGSDVTGFKLEKQIAKQKKTTTGELGFRITGMKVMCGTSTSKFSRKQHKSTCKSPISLQCSDAKNVNAPNLRLGLQVWNASKGEYDVFDRSFGHSLTVQDVPSAFKRFFDNSTGQNMLQENIPGILKQLDVFVRWQQHYGQDMFLFYGSSILLIYEGSSSPSNFPSHEPRFCLIDFPHVEIPEHNSERNADETKQRAAGRDDGDGVLFGMARLQSIFEQLLSDSSSSTS